MTQPLYALMAEFKTPTEMIEAIHSSKALGFKLIEAYSPFPVEGAAEKLGHSCHKIGWITLACGIIGVLSAYLLQYYSAKVAYPIDVGGRPLNSWPAFVPVCFELGVLCACAGAVFSMFFTNRLPQPYHPVFNVQEFSLASRNRFFITIEKADPLFDIDKTKIFLQGLGAERVIEVYQ